MRKTQRKALPDTASQIDVVTLAVFVAGGHQRAVDTEDVAVKAQELAPGRFSWRKYPGQINLELIRVYLSDAKKPSKGGWLTGSGRRGWLLTPAGLVWAKRNAKKLLGMNLERGREQSRSGSVDENRWRRERARIMATPAWEKWQTGEIGVTTPEASEVFRIDSYIVGPMRAAKVMRMRALFDADPRLGPFLARMAKLIEHEEVSR
jgi:hypothetical protein